MAVVLFLVAGLFFVGIGPLGLKNKGEIGVWGGPTEVSGAGQIQVLDPSNALLAGEPRVTGPDVQTDSVDPNPSRDLLNQGSLRSQSSPFGPGIPGSLLIYKVQSGDTLGKIAANFGISTETLIGSNPDAKKLKVGQELSILPVSGILYQLQSGQSLKAAADAFGISPNALRAYNPTLANAQLVIPGASPSLDRIPSDSSSRNLPNLKGYFVKPTTGFNWGVLHAHNGVDIANVCGTDIVAAAEGLVSASESDGWNGGYGSYVLIEHPNGTKTRYAHLSKLLVSVGDYLSQGQKIGLMGSTGDSTGCHLHFEVEGARNFMAK